MRTRTLGIGILCLLLGACANQGAPRQFLSAVGPALTAPAIIREIRANSAATGQLQPGDTIVAIDGQPIKSIRDLSRTIAESQPQTFTVTRGEQRLDLPFEVLQDSTSKRLNAYVLATGETFTSMDESRLGQSMMAANIAVGRLNGKVLASIWRADTNLMELELDIYTPDECSDCELRNIAVMDLARGAWLPLVPLEDAALLIVPGPTKESPIPKVASPSPAASASAGVALMAAYRAEYANLPFKLGEAADYYKIQRAKGEQFDFAYARLGNLRPAKLAPRELLQGHLFFAVPEGYDGPYLVFVDAGEKAITAARFTLAK
jgi:hypothetical protein